MALKHLDLEEQEQLDKIKAFWKQYGGIISGVLILVFGSIAAYNGWQWWQRSQSAQAASMYDEVERAAQSGDPAKISRAFADMKERYGGTTYAVQAALLSAKALYDKGQVEQAKAPLEWVASSAADESYRAVAKLRLASIMFESKAYDAALKLLDGLPKEFDGLAADRRGDILLAQGKREEAKAAFEKAHKAMDERSEYRRLVEVKLNTLGMDVSKLMASPIAATGAAAALAPAASAEKK